MFSARFLTFNKWVALAGIVFVGIALSLWHRVTAPNPAPVVLSQVHTGVQKEKSNIDASFPHIEYDMQQILNNTLE